MKKFFPIIIAVFLSSMLVVSLGLCFWQFKVGRQLVQRLEQKNIELKEAQKASKKIGELEKKGIELKKKEAKIYRQIAQKEEQPLELIKNIHKLATRQGMRNITFEFKKESAVKVDQKDNPPPSAKSPFKTKFFQMKAQATYPQLVSFIKELYELERIVAIEQIEIVRDKNIVPYQQVTIDMQTYVFSE
ncbi:MAG: type 4a pilus biogenesis protein PilO [Candidatus Omnitrophica bacterium]|nr:type 4a pilus biogenesis protein PilO [Candidatus Omnitrophota bacterium]